MIITKNLICAFAILVPLSVMGQPVSYSVNPAPTFVKQTKAWGCWATVFTMMHNWKQNKSTTISDAVGEISPIYQELYDADNGMVSEQKIKFMNDAKLKTEVPQTFSVKGWESLLKTYGPIWVTTDESPKLKKQAIHARLLIGIKGDQGSEFTELTFIDPVKGIVVEKFVDFIPKYEKEMRAVYKKLNGAELPGSYEFRVQIIHW
jgi:hypothetical protein